MKGIVDKENCIKRKGAVFNFNIMLLMFALIPLICSVFVICFILSSASKNEVKGATQNSMLALIHDTGIGMDNYFEEGEATLQSYITAPVVKEFLKKPNDTERAKQLQEYTVDFCNALNGVEGIYIADWNSKILTHSTEAVVGKVMREGERLTELQNAMIQSDGVYNMGIITSPASGDLIISMYLPIYDGDEPLGYAGLGIYARNALENYTDVSKLDLETAYTYMVDREGIMIHHPTAEKIGKPVENAVVSELVKRLRNGEHPESECIEYAYRGSLKYAAYYVGINESYIAVLTADATDVLSNVRKIELISIGVAVGLVLIFTILALAFAKKVVTPLNIIVRVLREISDGNIHADVEIHSMAHETRELIASAKTLQTVLQKIIGETQRAGEELYVDAQRVSGLADRGLERTEQISRAMEGLATGATTMAESVQSINEKILLMGNAIGDITANTEDLTSGSHKIMMANDDASSYIAKVSVSSERSVAAVQDIKKQIADTNQAINRIKDASDMITGIASQTNLLALNASIEAARAGEAGKGFAVVATEIKNLSEQSNASATEIKGIVAEIVDKSKHSVSLSDEVAYLITEEQQLVADTQNKFKLLRTEIDSSLHRIEYIGENVNTLNVSKEIIIGAVSDLSAISEENAASNQEVSASVLEISGAVNDIAINAEETANKSERLKQTISYFK